MGIINRLRQVIKKWLWRTWYKPKHTHASLQTDCDLQTRIFLDDTSSLHFLGTNVLINSKITLQNTSLTLQNVYLKNAHLDIRNAQIQIANDVHIENGELLVFNTNLQIDEHFRMYDYKIHFQDCPKIEMGKYSMLRKNAYKEGFWTATQSRISMGINNKIEAVIRCKKSNLVIGNHNFLNHGTEIRCEEAITMGNNNFVSYDCLIFDTNTHSTNPAHRIQEIENGFPNHTIQTDNEAPQTKPITIENNVWVGTRSAVLKGSDLKNDAIIGLYCVVVGLVPAYHLAYGNPYQTKPIA